MSRATLMLRQAAKQGDICALQTALEEGANVHDEDLQGWTPLMWACVNGNAEVVEALLSNKAGVRVTDTYGNTPLLIASTYGHVEAIEVLLARGEWVNTSDRAGRTALYHASLMGKLGAVSALLRAGADPCRASTRGKKPIDVVNLDSARAPAISRMLRAATIWRRRRAAVVACQEGMWEEPW